MLWAFSRADEAAVRIVEILPNFRVKMNVEQRARNKKNFSIQLYTLQRMCAVNKASPSVSGRPCGAYADDDFFG